MISTPPNTHAPLGLAAAQHGKHIFCEKPLATNLEEEVQLIQAAQENSVALIEDFVQRYNPLNELVHDLIKKRVMGNLVNIEISNYASDELLKPGHWFWNRQVSSGIWVEHGVHFFDLVTWWLGSQAGRAIAISAARAGGEEDRVWAIVRYQDGHTATFCHTFTQPAIFEQTDIRLIFSHGYVTLKGWIPTCLYLRAMVDQSELGCLEEHFDCQPVRLSDLPVKDCRGWANDEEYEAKYLVEFDLELSEGKQAVYQDCVKQAMLDLPGMICDPNFTPRVTAQDWMHALQAALAVTQAAQENRQIDLETKSK